MPRRAKPHAKQGSMSLTGKAVYLCFLLAVRELRVPGIPSAKTSSQPCDYHIRNFTERIVLDGFGRRCSAQMMELYLQQVWLSGSPPQILVAMRFLSLELPAWLPVPCPWLQANTCR